MPQLEGVLGQIQPYVGNAVNTNPTEQSALYHLGYNAQQGNPFAPAINGVASNLLAGGGPDRSGYTTTGYDQLQSSLTPISTQSTDPYSNPSFQNLVKTLTNDTTDQIKSAYAGAGYSPVAAGDFAQQLGRGISQGVAPAFVQAQDTLTNQRANAANSLYQGGVGTSGALSALDQTKLANQLQGVSTSTDALNANDSPYLRALQVSQMGRQLPLSNIGNAESLLLPIAGLGGTSNTNATQNTQTSSNPGLLGSIMGIGSLFSGGANSAFSGMGGPGLLGWIGTKLG